MAPIVLGFQSRTAGSFFFFFVLSTGKEQSEQEALSLYLLCVLSLNHGNFRMLGPGLNLEV